MLLTKKLLDIFPAAAQTPMNLDQIVETINASPFLTTVDRMAGFCAGCT